ncbi:MAG: carbon starvation protein A [Akkermansia sp.]|nr:carbon starvation protein A [Akkermansia sp.]
MSGFIVYLVCALLLVAGYFFYGRLAEKIFGLDRNMVMPCDSRADGIDFVPLSTWRIFLIQLLNIAGLGPVVGAISGCLFGPVALLWIVIGCIFAGALHDFLSACMSATRGGENLPEIVGTELGEPARYAMRLVCIFLLLMVGVVFTLLPAGMISNLFGLMPALGWSVVILGYYFLATILPIGTIIGRIYPFFGAIFLFMAVGMAVMLPVGGHEVLPNLDFFTNQHPKGLSVWPMLFVTIACGAISGFHATQSPMMVRCLRKAGNLRRVFYGAMVVEGLVALVWCVVGLSLRAVVVGDDAQTFEALILQNPSFAVHQACTLLLGSSGGMIAVLGVVVLAITSGDTAMRSCRLMLADVLHVKQNRMLPRLALALPLFAIVITISQLDFGAIWRYFGWGNQALACFTLWSITVCLRRRGRSCLVALLPSLFMTCMCTTFLLHAPECGIAMPLTWSTGGGCLVSALCLVLFIRFSFRKADKDSH